MDHKQRRENHQTSSNSSGVSLSGSFVLSENKPYAFNTKRGAIIVGSGKTSAGLNGSFGKGTNETDFSWMDLNGNGLPDRVWIGEDQMGAGKSCTCGSTWATPSMKRKCRTLTGRPTST